MVKKNYFEQITENRKIDFHSFQNNAQRFGQKIKMALLEGGGGGSACC